MATPTKCPQGVRQNASMKTKNQENSNPNLSSFGLKPTNCSPIKSPKVDEFGGKSGKVQSFGMKPSNCSPIKSPKVDKVGGKSGKIQSFVSPKRRIKDRKFVVVAKKRNDLKKVQDFENPDCKCGSKVNGKCLCVAYESLRVSQEEFFKGKEFEKVGLMLDIEENDNGDFEGEKGEVSGSNEGGFGPEKGESPKGMGSSTIKRRRDILMEEARASVPEPGSGRVLHLVKAFEKLLTIPKESDNKDEKVDDEKLDDDDNDGKKSIKWALPGLQQQQQQRQQPPIARLTEDPLSGFCPGELFFNAESLGLDANVSASLDGSRGSVSSTSSVGSRRSRRSGSFSSGTVGGSKWKKKQQKKKATSLKPFRLRTEQRGKMKEEEFVKKLQEMMIEEEKQRIPIAQGLPWTTDEPECLIKPPIKECTKPVDLKLHSDIRAVERADFDHQVSEKLMLIEQYKMERERQQKLEEEEEIRRLRKELVPKAQPMPYFDRPFIPRRSEKQPTIPKDPKFHFPQQKKIKCSLSWNDLNDCIHAAS